MLYYDISFQGIKKSPSLRAMMTIWAWYIVNLYLEHTFLILCFLKWICYEVTFMLLPPLFCKMIMQFPCNLVLFVQNEKWLREVALQEYIKLVSLLRCTGVIRLVGRLSAFLCVHASSVVKKKKKSTMVLSWKGCTDCESHLACLGGSDLSSQSVILGWEFSCAGNYFLCAFLKVLGPSFHSFDLL